jgi:hypothetical protein
MYMVPPTQFRCYGSNHNMASWIKIKKCYGQLDKNKKCVNWQHYIIAGILTYVGRHSLLSAPTTLSTSSMQSSKMKVKGVQLAASFKDED